MTDKTPGEKAADRLDQERLEHIRRVRRLGELLGHVVAQLTVWSDEPGDPSMARMVGGVTAGLETLQALADEHHGAPWARS